MYMYSLKCKETPLRTPIISQNGRILKEETQMASNLGKCLTFLGSRRGPICPVCQ